MKNQKKKDPLIKKIAVTGILTASLGLGFWASKAFYTVDKVIDGDTFITKEDQAIRFDSVNAPEPDQCLGSESKAFLTKLILHKKVFIKVRYVDGFKRLVGSVYSIRGNVGAIMVSNGLATFSDKGLGVENLYPLAQKARDKKIGVYSATCTQEVNSVNPKCNIKANTSGLGKFYRYPGCGQYENTLVQLHFGDKWFCTETEARNAGFKKGTDCK